MYEPEDVVIVRPAHLQLLRQVIPLWYAEVAWAKQLLQSVFGLDKAEDILLPQNRGRRQIPGTVWFVCTHGKGVDVYKTPYVGGVDFDFDTPDPDAWRLSLFFGRQANEGVLPYSEYKELIEDEDLLMQTLYILYEK